MGGNFSNDLFHNILRKIFYQDVTCYVAELSVFEGNDLITRCLSSLLTTISHYLAVFYNRISGNTKFKRMK